MAGQGDRRVRIAHRGVSLVLVIAGGLLLRARMGVAASVGQYLVALLMIAVGIGVWKYQRWARWLALGACFLGVLGAIGFTFNRFLTHPADGFDETFRFNLAASMFAFAVPPRPAPIWRPCLPETNQARGFSIGTPYDVFGQVAGTYEYFVKLDPFDAFQESNELNNLVGARFTILPDGTVDLPGCDTLAALASDHDWLADDVALQPAFVPLPDLVPLGLCIKDWGAGSRYLQIVYGNIGNVSSPEPVRIEIGDAPKPKNNYIARSRIPSPGFIAVAGTARRAEDAREVEWVIVDSAHALLELSESNNAARFVLASR